MSPSLINLGALPGHDMLPETIRSGAVRLRSAGSEVETASAGVVKTWHRLDHVYDAPESGLLLAAMNPVKSSGSTLSEHLGSAATALETFADEVEAVQKAVAAIQADALAFFATIPGGKSTVTVHSTRDGDTTKKVDWWDDPDAAKANDALLTRVEAQASLLSAAEDRCYFTLMGLAEGTFQGTENGGPGYYTGPPAWVENPPWGAPVRIPELFEDPIGKAVKKVALSTVASLIGQLGWNTSGYHYDLDLTAGEQGPMTTGGWSWQQLLASKGEQLQSLWALAVPKHLMPTSESMVIGVTLLAGAALSGRPVQDPQEHPGTAIVGGILAIEDWKKHPWSALTEVGINAASMVVGGPELGAAGKAGEAGRLASEASTTARIAADAEHASPLTRLAEIGGEVRPRTVTAPTVDALKAAAEGRGLDNAWTKNLDGLHDKIDVRDNDITTDRPNVPRPDTGAPTLDDAPSARPHGHSSDSGCTAANGSPKAPKPDDTHLSDQTTAPARGGSGPYRPTEPGAGSREPALVGAPERAGSASSKPEVPAARPLDSDAAGPRVRTDGPETAEMTKTGTTSHLGHDASLDAHPPSVRDPAPGVTHGPRDSPLATDHGSDGEGAGHSRSSSDGLNATDHSPSGHDGPVPSDDPGTPPHDLSSDARSGPEGQGEGSASGADHAHPEVAGGSDHPELSTSDVGDKLKGSTNGFSWETPKGRQAWVDEAKADPEHTRRVSGSKPADDYQREVVGDPEVRLGRSDNDRIWADGVGVDPDKVVALEAKYVANPARSIYEGRGPAFLQEDMMEQFDGEMRRYAAAMKSTDNPVQRLRIITNTPRAAEYLGNRARGILGPKADLHVVVEPWKPAK